MHEDKKLEARHINPFKRDALSGEVAALPGTLRQPIMEAPDPADLSSLLERLTHGRKLLEHQLWEAARRLSIDRSSPAGRRFARLVEAGAMLDAAMLLVTMSSPGPSPGRFVSSVGNTGSRWTCTVRPTAALPGARTKRFRMEHADLPAAVLASLISSLLDADENPQAKGSPNPQKRKRKHHDS
jgi:hypothetical protein